MFVPATPDRLHPDVIPAILAAGRTAVAFPCIGQLEYARQLADAWLLWADLIIVEHDVIVTAQILDGFAGCGKPWCVAPYNDHHALGCSRFRPAQLGSWPVADVLVPWDRLDLAISAGLEARGHRACVHREHRPDHRHAQ